MDPLSIIASSIAIAHVVHTSLKAAYAFHHAKPELMALSNEISDLLLVLRELEAALYRRSLSPTQLHPTSGLSSATTNVKQKLEQLSNQVSTWGSQSEVNQPKVKSIRARRLRIAYEAKKFKEEFRELRMRLSSLLIVIGVSVDCAKTLCSGQIDMSTGPFPHASRSTSVRYSFGPRK